MHKKKSAINYHFRDLKSIADDYSGFSFESANSILHHHEDFYELTLITAGEWQHTINNITTVLPIGTLLLFKPGITHVISSESTQNVHLVFGVEQRYFEDYISRMFPDFALDEFSDYVAKPIHAEKRKYIEYLAKNIHKNPDSAHAMADEILYACLSDFTYLNTRPNQSAYVTDIIQKLNNHTYLNISVKDICANYPLAQPILLRHFKRATGMTIVQYKAQQKLKYACHLLKHSDISVSNIAMHLQYDSLSYFVRSFKEAYNMTPSEYRKTHRNP